MRNLSRAARAGFTLVELLVAITVAGFVMAALYRVLEGNQRFYRAQSQIIGVQENVRAVAQILTGELRELDASGGDIIHMEQTHITIKAMRSFSIACTAPNVAAAQITVRNALTFGYRSMDAARDSVLLFREGDPRTGSDDVWLRAPIGAMSASSCTDGAAGTRLTLTGLTATQLGPNGALRDAGVLPGAPVRTFEVVSYRLYNDGTGVWWLGMRTHSGGAWSSISPVAGPLRASDGVGLQYLNSSGAVTATPTAVARIQLTVRGRSTQPINIPGRPAGYFQDSIVTQVALRNNVR